MDHGMQATLLRQLFNEARTKVKTGTDLTGALELQGRLKVASTGVPARFSQIAAFRTLLGQVAADGVLTDQEIKTVVAFLVKQDLMLVLPAPVDVVVDFNAIELPPLG